MGKARYLREESPQFAEQQAFDQALNELGVFDFSSYGPTQSVFAATLALYRRAIEGFRLVPSTAIPTLDESCGRYFKFRDLIECGETQKTSELANAPSDVATYNALFDLATKILDPLIDYFGMVRLTYGFCSAGLAKLIPAHTAPALDQHAAHERNRAGKFISPRLGAAADFIVEDENMFEVAQWIATHLPFDRLYIYAKDRPLHISYGPEHSREVVHVERRGGRTVPRVVRDMAVLTTL